MTNQRLLDGKRFHNGAHVVPVGARDGFGDLYLETVAKSGRPTIAYCIWEHGSDKAGATPPDLRGYDPLTEAKEKYKQYSPLGEDGVLTIAREDKIWQPGMAPDEKRDLQAWEPQNHASPEAAADEYWSIIWPIIQVNPQADVWGAFNEYSSNWEWQSRFYIRLMEHANAAGVVLALGNYSSGNPPRISEEEDPERYTVFDQWLPWLDFAGKHGHIFCTHEYFDFDPNHPELHVGRFVYMYDRMIEKGITLPPLVVGEMGYVSFPGNDTFIDGMISNDILYRTHGYVLGGCAFTYGKWGSNPGANIQTASERYGKLLASTIPWPDPEQPTPEPPIKNRGAPRFDYPREFWVLPGTETEEEAIAVFKEARKVKLKGGGRRTTGWSYDDAGIGDLSSRTAVLFGIPKDEEQELVTFYDEDYPGVIVLFRDLPDGDLPDPPDPPIKVFNTVWPTTTPQPERVITSDFGLRDSGIHYGIDIRAAEGTPLVAVADGVVDRVGYESNGFGLYLVLRHRMGDGRKRETFYAHLRERAESLVGVFFLQGETIPDAFTGNTGKSTGAHLHHEIRVEGVAIDPMSVMIESEKPSEPTEPPPEETHIPVAMLHLAASGLHPNDPNGSFMTDLNMLKDARMDGFVFTTNSDIDPDSLGILLAQTNIKPENVIIRLHMPGSDPNVANPAKYVELHRAWIRHGLGHGVRKFQLWNEPNLDQSMVDAGIIGAHQMEWPHDAEKFADVFADVADRLFKEYGTNLKIGFPPMSPQENAHSYYQASSFGMAFSDWFAIHAYFSTDGAGQFGIDSRDGGLYWQRVLEWIPEDVPVWITEFADNGAGVDISRARRTVEYYTKQYPLRIKGLACYISQDVNWPLQAWDKNPHMVGAVRDR